MENKMGNKMGNKMTTDEFVKLLNEKYSKANIENEFKKSGDPLKVASDMLLKLMKDVSDYAESKKAAKNSENDLKAVPAKSKDYYEGYNMAIRQMKEVFSIDLHALNTIKENTTTCILNNLEMIAKNESKVDKGAFRELVVSLDELNSAVRSIKNTEKNISIIDKLSNNLLPPESK
nr:MAG TPA: hypothetical protein [Caudoviricetes sp.]